MECEDKEYLQLFPNEVQWCTSVDKETPSESKEEILFLAELSDCRPVHKKSPNRVA